ncbi:hypothetical protein T492DRAFT_895145 [Pavlovales sp. CCMP2436]|nr:hypothetical protein T492DRAFT_895145 [Pavlovales sp. CCMP2436]
MYCDTTAQSRQAMRGGLLPIAASEPTGRLLEQLQRANETGACVCAAAAWIFCAALTARVQRVLPTASAESWAPLEAPFLAAVAAFG